MPVDDYYQDYGPIKRRRAAQPREPLFDETPSRTSQWDEPLYDNQWDEPTPPVMRRITRQRRPPYGVLFVLLLLLIAVPFVLPYAVEFAYRGQALPGVHIQGVAVSGQSANSINATLEARYADFLRQPVELTYGTQVWQPTLADLGAQFDTASVAQRAVTLGRHGDPIARMRDLWTLWNTGVEIAPHLAVDRNVLNRYLLTTREIERPPQDAALSIAAAQIIGTPSQAGNQLLVDASANDVLLALQTLAPQQIALRTRVLEPTVGDAALVGAETDATALLQSPLVLAHGDNTWTWEPDKLAELLRIDAVDGRLAVRVDDDQLNRAVQRLAQLVDTGTAEPRLRFAGGSVQIVQDGQPGWQLQQAAAAQVISDTLMTTEATTRTLALPIDQLQPQVTAANIGSLGIVELVGEGLSSFSGSAQYRITNIKAGAARMDGVLIAPNEEFSFNTQLGDVDESNGFVQGYAIIGNRTQLEWGGGVCQDSTTVFRAAFWAGLPITERHAHSFYISWYDQYGLGSYGNGAGLDAAIFTGVNDLKFVNDTGNWLLMQTYVDEANQVLGVQLYGTKPNRDVVLEGPYITNEVAAPAEPVYLNDSSQPAGTVVQSDVARGGRDISIDRVIIENGQEVRRDTVFTRFKAWPNVFVRGTGG